MTTIDDVKKYINERYPRWFDYSQYQCTRAKIADESYDVLNEVLCAYLSYPHEKLLALYNERKGTGMRLLDLYILSSIHTNVWKATSNYQYKYHRDKYYAKYHDLPILIEYLNELPDTEDGDADTVRQKKEDELYRRFSAFCKKLNITPLAIKVFYFRFFEHRKWSEWPGKESRYKLTKLYHQTKEIIFRELNVNSEEGK
jgi:hypothetical protein